MLYSSAPVVESDTTALRLRARWEFESPQGHLNFNTLPALRQEQLGSELGDNRDEAPNRYKL